KRHNSTEIATKKDHIRVTGFHPRAHRAASVRGDGGGRRMNAITKTISLDDKYLAVGGRVYLSGIQALVRLPLDRARLDREAGLKTGGFISGYRGSPLAGYDTELMRARRHLDPAGIVFKPGVNEELGATAVWGSQ